MKKQVIKFSFAIILLIIIMFLIILIMISYNQGPKEAYSINPEIIFSENFENFNGTLGDCCNADSNKSKVFLSKSEDAFEGTYSLNLTSEFQCACTSIPFKNFSNLEKYYISIEYKGENAKFCNWVPEDNKCLSLKKANPSDTWNVLNGVLIFTNKSKNSFIYFYADNLYGSHSVTNLYDALEVRKLIPINNQGPFSITEDYIIKTKSDNVVSARCREGLDQSNCYVEKLSEDDATKEAYYLIGGIPSIKIKFPWNEIVIIIVLMIVLVRLLCGLHPKKYTNS